MRMLIISLIFALLAGCASIMPEKSNTKLEKSPCACGEGIERHYA